MNNFSKYIEANKKAWNERTPIHIKSEFYKNEDFKDGCNSLKSIELKALSNIKDKSILHLQCHFGQDSMSLSRMGAKVTAVDFSDVAINHAKKISNDINVNVDFIEGNVLELNINKSFDIVFSSYGVLGWLHDLDKWAVGISNHLKKGGVFLLTEFHPFLQMIKDDGYNYFYSSKPDIEVEKGTYTDGGLSLVTKTCWWNHSLTDIFTALESNGLKLSNFEEFDYSPYRLDGMIQKEEGKYVLEKRKRLSTPYVFNLKAIKK